MSPRSRRPIGSYGQTVELEFQVRDDRLFLVSAAAAHGCELVVEETIQQSSGSLIQFVSVDDDAVVDVLGDALNRPDIMDAKLLCRAEENELGLLELVTVGPSLARTVAESRALARYVSADRWGGRLTVEVPPSTDAQGVIEVVRDTHPETRLVARTERESGFPLGAGAARERLLADLTDRQREALQTAYRDGYFDTPRRTTASECADALGISQSTYSQHLHVALQKLFQALFEESGG